MREQVDAVGDAAAPQVRHRRDAELGAEAADQVGRADVRGAGELGEVERGIGEPGVDVAARPLDRVVGRRGPGDGLARVAPEARRRPGRRAAAGRSTAACGRPPPPRRRARRARSTAAALAGAPRTRRPRRAPGSTSDGCRGEREGLAVAGEQQRHLTRLDRERRLVVDRDRRAAAVDEDELEVVLPARSEGAVRRVRDLARADINLRQQVEHPGHRRRRTPRLASASWASRVDQYRPLPRARLPDRARPRWT